MIAESKATDVLGYISLVSTSWHYAISRVLVLCLAAYIVWQYLLRSRALWNSKSEPPMLPYWLPGNRVSRSTIAINEAKFCSGVGHSIAFIRDTHKTLIAARSDLS
jgi:hypothetical protein